MRGTRGLPGQEEPSPHTPIRAFTFSEIKDVVGSRFILQDAYIDARGVPTFTISPENFKNKFTSFANELENRQLLPTLRKEGDQYALRIFAKPQVRKPSRPYLNIVLLAAALCTIFVAGYFNFLSTPILSQVLMKDENIYLQATLFTVSLFGIISLHELGHLIACRKHDMDSTLPYFIPGPPPFGTFGAVVSLKSAPKNRDELFDTGMGGPLTGFIATMIVLLIDSFYRLDIRITSFAQAKVWEEKGFIQFVSWPNAPLLFYLQDLLNPVPSNQVLMPSPLQFVVLVGALVTFLNILPVWQLDGGHISRAMWGPRGHRVASLIGLGFLFASGYWFFALFLLLMMFGSKRAFQGAEPLDDVSPLNGSRRILYALIMAILILCFFVWTPLA